MHQHDSSHSLTSNNQRRLLVSIVRKNIKIFFNRVQSKVTTIYRNVQLKYKCII